MEGDLCCPSLIFSQPLAQSEKRGTSFVALTPRRAIRLRTAASTVAPVAIPPPYSSGIGSLIFSFDCLYCICGCQGSLQLDCTGPECPCQYPPFVIRGCFWNGLCLMKWNSSEKHLYKMTSLKNKLFVLASHDKLVS